LLNTDDCWDILWNTGYRGFLNQLNVSDLSRFKAEHLNEIEQFKTDDGLWLNIHIYSSARKP